MEKLKIRHPRMLLVALALMMAVLAVGNSANADFSYDFKFDALTSNNIIYPAGEFSFISPALIGPSVVNPSFIDTLNPIPSSTLNGYSFSGILWASYTTNPGGFMIKLVFEPDPIPTSVPPPAGEISGFAAGINFSPGGYGAGTYTSTQFGRLIGTAASGVDFVDSTGTLIISEVVVPVPPSLLLVAPGLLGLWFFRRRA